MKLVGVLLLSMLVGSVLGLKQYVEFYQQTSNCDTEPETTRTVSNFTNQRPPNVAINIPIYRSFNVFGMWQIGRCSGNSVTLPCTNLPASVEYMTYIANQPICVRVDGTPGPTGYEGRRFGDAAMTAPQLALFDRANFSPESQMTLVMSQGLTSASLSIKSFFFTGNHHWTIYDEVDYRGRGTCLRPAQDVVRRGYGFTTELATDQTIRSVRFGCNASSQLTTSLVLMVVLYVMGKTL